MLALGFSLGKRYAPTERKTISMVLTFIFNKD